MACAPREDRSGSDSGFVTSLAGSLPKVATFRDVLTGGDNLGMGAEGWLILGQFDGGYIPTRPTSYLFHV